MTKHYIRLDDQNRIIDGWSDGLRPDKDTSTAILLRENEQYQFRLFEDGQQNPDLFEDHGIPLYKWDGKQVLPRTPEEIQADRDKLPPSQPSLNNRVDTLEENDVKMQSSIDSLTSGIMMAR